MFFGEKGVLLLYREKKNPANPAELILYFFSRCMIHTGKTNTMDIQTLLQETKTPLPPPPPPLSPLPRGQKHNCGSGKQRKERVLSRWLQDSQDTLIEELMAMFQSEEWSSESMPKEWLNDDVMVQDAAEFLTEYVFEQVYNVTHVLKTSLARSAAGSAKPTNESTDGNNKEPQE